LETAIETSSENNSLITSKSDTTVILSMLTSWCQAP
jgi:hypothetical protein